MNNFLRSSFKGQGVPSTSITVVTSIHICEVYATAAKMQLWPKVDLGAELAAPL